MSSISSQIQPVTLDSKPTLDSYFKTGSFLNSEFTFTNMFIWQNPYNIRYAVIDGNLCIFSAHGSNPESVNMTTMSGDIKTTVPKLLDYFAGIGQAPVIRIFGKDQKEQMKTTFPDMFRYEKDTDSADYVYKIQHLIELPGSRYHAKRNHINKFKNLYNYRYKAMTPEFREDCRSLFSHWCNTKRDTISNIDEQLYAVNTLLDNWDKLDISGGCITVDDRLIAFSFGEVLCQKESIVVIHLEHANTDFHGSFPIMNQQFLENQWSDFQYVNREEDMGLEGLRKAKKSYHPSFLTDKYILTLK